MILIISFSRWMSASYHRRGLFASPPLPLVPLSEIWKYSHRGDVVHIYTLLAFSHILLFLSIVKTCYY